jgi:hypothetical protein
MSETSQSESSGGWVENRSSTSSSSGLYETLNNGATLVVPLAQQAPVYVTFTGDPGETATVTLNVVHNYTVGNVGGSFVWDIGGANEYTFTFIGDSVIQNAGGSAYTIT